MRIMLATYSAATHTSYGKVTRETWRRILKLRPSWQVVQQGWFHRTQESMEQVPWPIEPTLVSRTDDGLMVSDKSDIYGQRSFRDALDKFQPDVVWSLGDPYMMQHMGQYRSTHGFSLIKHCPADSGPVPAPWREGLSDCDIFVPITKYATKSYSHHIKDMPLQHIYHGVDLEKFTLPTRQQREKARPAGLIGKDTFVLGFLGHSQFRKQTWNLFELMKYLVEGAYWVNPDTDEIILDHLDDTDMSFHREGVPPGELWVRPAKMDVVLWFHCFKRGSNFDYPPKWLRHYYGLDKHVIFSKGMGFYDGLPDDQMPQFYRALDAYLSLSGGEGFCLPLVEAMATGVPVVYTNYSGQAEVGAHGGLPVKATIIREMKSLTGRAIVDMADAVRQVRRLWADKKVREVLGARGRAAVETTFNWNNIAQQWVNLIEANCAPNRIDTMGVSL